MFFTGSRSGVMPHDDAFHRTRSAVGPAAERPRSSRPGARAPPRGGAANAAAAGGGPGVRAAGLLPTAPPPTGAADRRGVGAGYGRSGLVGALLGLDEELGGARVDLGGGEVAADEPAVGAVVLLEELHGPREALAAGLLVPLPHDATAVAREPASRAEGQA